MRPMTAQEHARAVDVSKQEQCMEGLFSFTIAFSLTINFQNDKANSYQSLQTASILSDTPKMGDKQI